METDLLLGVLALGAGQLVITLWFLWRCWRRAPAEWIPGVSVFIPCAGEVQGLEGNIRSLLEQDYPGKREYVFVTPSAKDPAHRLIEKLLFVESLPARLLASERAPVGCSGKVSDLLYALEREAKDAELLVFADCDVRVRRDWLSSLTSALAEPGICVATSAALLIPGGKGFWGLMRLVWMAAGQPYLAATRCVCGHSFAMRASDFRELEVAKIWARSVMEDLSLSALLAGWRNVRFCGQAMPVSAEKCGFRDYLGQFNKWILMFRVYLPLAWTMGLFMTLFKASVMFWSLTPPFSPGLFAVLWSVDAINLYILFTGLLRRIPDRFEGLHPPYRSGLPVYAALSAPLLQLTYLVNFLNSLWTHEIAWGRYLYRFSSDGRAEVAPR
ncbi:MAG: glycosyltransferase family 2 protein [Elusimicrobiota bacterium]